MEPTCADEARTSDPRRGVGGGHAHVVDAGVELVGVAE